MSSTRALGALAVALGALAARPALAADQCRVAEFDFTPTDDLQVVVWIEDTAGNYIDTAFITQETGTYGLGNRPGIMDFNSGPWWPYGRRTTTFPVWSSRHGMEWPEVIFQDEDDRDLSHDLDQSSREHHFCRPIRPDETLWDAQSCASTVWTDKGKLSPTDKSHYPPRADLTFDSARDDGAVNGFATMNPFDAVSRATPVGGQAFQASWSLPRDLPDGQYVAWMEVGKEFDQNTSYAYPSPSPISWSEYGQAYRGQPSVLYKVEFTVSNGETAASTLDYVGYGDPDGLDGTVRAPDGTITSDTPGSGAGRLLVTSDGADMFRLRVKTHGVPDTIAPGGIAEAKVTGVQPNAVSASFIAPGDDDLEGMVAGYEVRYLAGGTIDDNNFADGTLAGVQITPAAAGTRHVITVPGLLPATRYSIGIRAYDECNNLGPVVAIDATTPRAPSGTVDACFIATAAYGSLMANEVEALRGFRDAALRSHVAGELLVEAYYTFGPLAAKVIAPSEVLRRAARDLLAPAVDLARRARGELFFLR